MSKQIDHHFNTFVHGVRRAVRSLKSADLIAEMPADAWAERAAKLAGTDPVGAAASLYMASWAKAGRPAGEVDG